MSLLINLSKNTLNFIKNKNLYYRFLTTYYTTNHEWIKTSDNKTGFIGITDYAQNALGDIVYCDIEPVGENIEKGNPFGVLESVKASSDIYMPITGDIIDINPELENNSSIVNSSPMEDGWLIKINIMDIKELDLLLTEDDYNDII